MNKKIRTDLAVELKDNIDEKDALSGIKMTNTHDIHSRINKCIIDIENKKGERLLGKPIGKYITLECSELDEVDINVHKPLVEALYKVLEEILSGCEKILVVGLGNRGVTPDSLGPKVIDNLYITRHLVQEGLAKNIREISAIAPGVMAQTGIETQKLLRALCNDIKPDIVLAIDALAAIDPRRLNKTIQICDTGINPGSGVGNNRGRLDKKSIGVKVIAIGVPTVISVRSLLGSFADDFTKCNDLRVKQDYDYSFVDDNELYKMYVTPQNVDEAVKRISFTLSEAINMLIGISI